LLFFLFTDPPPPAISPLSLHDALPIFLRARRRGRLPARALGRLPRRLRALAPNAREPARVRRVRRARHVRADPVRVPAGRLPGRDRKSTRLNSSHDQISYAVFCLKKKK